MTPRNQQLLMIMSWARSFHGLSLEDCERIAGLVLDEFGGDLVDARPSEVMSAFDRTYFALNSQGEAQGGDHTTPTWEEHGLVRPPQLDATGASGVISDLTFVDAHAMAYHAVADELNIRVASDASAPGAHPTGELVLQSGGTVPPLPAGQRDTIWPIIFSDPVGHDQAAIDAWVASPPSEFVPSSYVEERALEVYTALSNKADEIAQQLREQAADFSNAHSH
jgi:hypothetical protein